MLSMAASFAVRAGAFTWLHRVGAEFSCRSTACTATVLAIMAPIFVKAGPSGVPEKLYQRVALP
jgi:hypothetical protein